ncbi:MAG TPA: hypothetical protein VMZ69_06390, partial [Saprospiraceae bacterium]|nr:hypothetical protein [Saprospiraceae bacterium]
MFAFLLLLQNASAQRLGLLPPSVKWKQLVDDSLRIIHPEGQEENAKRVASLMLKFASLDPVTLKGRYRPISILLQPYTNISNGYVGLAPYVSEFYLQPNENPFTLGSLPWVDLLSVHEYRHVQQVNAANTGFSHLAKMVFGELAFTGLYNLSVPNWFREGDAVYGETKWTLQGRGRLSHFTLPFRMKLMEGEPWNYYKVRNGSYKEFTPDHYPLGYLLVQYGNHLFGESTWDTIIQEAARFKHLISPFSGPIEERTGFRNKHLYQNAMIWWKEKWKEEQEENIEYPFVALPQKDFENDYFDMNFPEADDKGNIYTSITTFDRTTAIYLINADGERKKVVSMGLQQDVCFDHSFHRLVWTELRFDPRWLRKDKNVIVVYDEETGNQISIDPEKGYYTPTLDKRAVRIVALHADQEGKYNLQLLDARSGFIIATLPNPENLYLGYPIWNEDETGIIATARNKDGQMALVHQDIATGAITPITHYSFNILGRPQLLDHWIVLTSNIDHIDQVNAIDMDEGIFYQVSTGNNAHYDPAWDPMQKSIICAEYDLKGKKLVRLSSNHDDWKLVNLDDGIKPVQGETNINLLALKTDTRTFSDKKYSPWFNALNFHSWTITADDPVWAAEVRSDNILNNIALAAGYEFNRNSSASGPYLDVRFGMWYPVLSLGVSRTSSEVKISDGTEVLISNDRIDAGVSLPLFYSSGVFQQTVLLSSTYNAGLSKTRPVIEGEEDFHFNYLSNQIILINSRRRAYRQAMPTWAQRVDAMYSHEVKGDPISQFYLSSDLALPAIKASHYLLLRGELLFQDIRKGSIQLGSPYVGARGFDEFIGKLQYRGGVTYGFPILYPDIG